MIRLIVVHKTKLIANIIASVLTEEPDVYLIGTAVVREEALSKAELSNCNMMLVSATLSDRGALALTEAVADVDPAIKVLIIGVPKSENVILQYVMAGASGYVLQNVSVEQ